MRRAMIYGLLLAGTLCTSLGCKRVMQAAKEMKSDESGSSAAVAVTGPVSLNWEQSYKVTASGTKGEGTFFVTKDADKPPLKLQASFHGFPKGTKVKIGSDEGTLSDGGYWSTMVDIKPALLKQTLDELKGPVDLDLELRVEVPGAPAPAVSKLQKQNVKEGLRAALLKARDAGVNLDANDQPAAKPRGAAVISGYSDLEFIGSAKNLTELDWVVIAEDQKEPRATKTCQFKGGPSTLKMFDANVIVVERRSAKKLAENVIKASDECPMFALVNKTDNTVKNSVMQKDVVAWARTELDKASR